MALLCTDVLEILHLLLFRHMFVQALVLIHYLIHYRMLRRPTEHQHLLRLHQLESINKQVLLLRSPLQVRRMAKLRQQRKIYKVTLNALLLYW